MPRDKDERPPRFQARAILLLATVLTVFLGCAGSGTPNSGSSSDQSAGCGLPPTIPTPIPVWLAYPPDGSTGITTTIGELIEVGVPAEVGLTLNVTTATGASVSLGTPVIAPSPYPTPFATEPPIWANRPYYAVPLPTLSPNTTYTVSDSYTGWANNPPTCSATYTQRAGAFTTGS